MRLALPLSLLTTSLAAFFVDPASDGPQAQVLAPVVRAEANGKLRGGLAELVSQCLATGRGNTPLTVLVRVDGPACDFSKLQGARSLPVFDEAMDVLREDEQMRSVLALEAEAQLRDGAVAGAIEAIGGQALRSFWLAPGLLARLPARGVEELARRSDVISIAPDHAVGPNRQNCGSPPPQWGNLTWISSAPITGPQPPYAVYTYGGEGQIKQGEAQGAGYTGAALLSGAYSPFRIPLTVADSGFDLETDQWRGGSSCWCPPTTFDVLSNCPNPPLGAHGEFTAREGGPSCIFVDRVKYGSQYTTDVWDDVFPGIDGFDTPNAVVWEQGQNWVGYMHGTATASLAAGEQYMDTGGDVSGSNCIPWCIFDAMGDSLCGLNGMKGVAPGAELRLLKIGQDQPGAGSTNAVEIQALQAATGNGSWVFNMSYTGDPDPLGLLSIAMDQAANDFDLVIVVSSGDLGGASVAEVGSGFYNGLIVGAVGMTGAFRDAVAPGSSHGPLAWPLSNPTTISQRDGVNICAPGGYWTSTSTSDGMRVPFPDESKTQSFSYGFTNGFWVANNVVGTSLSAPLVAGVVANLLSGEAKRWNTSQRILTSREVRAIVLNQADQGIAALPANSAETPFGYGQGRTDAFATAGFFQRGGISELGFVRPSKPSKTFVHTFTQGQPVEITLTWDRVVFPATDWRCSNLQLEVFTGLLGGGSQTVPIAQSIHPENNFERVIFTPQTTGNYTIRVRVPNGGFVVDSVHPDHPVPFALAIL